MSSDSDFNSFTAHSTPTLAQRRLYELVRSYKSAETGDELLDAEIYSITFKGTGFTDGEIKAAIGRFPAL